MLFPTLLPFHGDQNITFTSLANKQLVLEQPLIGWFIP